MNTPFFLAEGLIIKHHGKPLEYARRSADILQFEDPESGHITSIPEEMFFEHLLHREITILSQAVSTPKDLILPAETSTDPEKPLDLSELSSERYKSAALRRYDYVVRLKKAGITKGQLGLIADEIKRIAIEISDPKPPSEVTAAAWMRKYEKSPDIYTLSDSAALRKGRVRREKEHDALIDELLERYYLRREPLKIGEIYACHYLPSLASLNETRVALGLAEFLPIAERTIYRIAKRLDDQTVKIHQLGREQARHATRFMQGHLQSKRALEYVEIDHALLDIFVIDDVLMVPLGRPWITIFRCRYSGAVIGLYVSFHGPSVSSIFAGLRHSLYPHDRIRLVWADIENILPHGFGEIYVSDRGLDFLSIRYRLGIAQLGASYEYCKSRTPWLKGSVERFFRTLNYMLETIPGKTFRSLEQRKDYDPRTQSVCRFTSFIWILYKWAADVYNVQQARHREASPLELFNESVSKYPRSYPRNIEHVRTILGDRHESRLSHTGVQFKGLHYIGDELEALYKAIGPNQKVIWHMDNSNLGYIHVMDPRTNRFFMAFCSRPDYANGLSLLQHECLRQQVAMQSGNTRLASVEKLSVARNEIREKIGNEIRQKETSGKRNLAKLCGVSSETVLNGEQRTILQPFPQSEADTPITDIGTEQPFFEVPTLGWSIL